MKKLKVCPFCGSEASCTPYYDKYSISCDNKKCNIVMAVEDTCKQATTSWNTRSSISVEELNDIICNNFGENSKQTFYGLAIAIKDRIDNGK